MKFKNYTQAYFLINYNNSYAYSLLKRVQCVTGYAYFTALTIYAFWPTRAYATEQIK